MSNARLAARIKAQNRVVDAILRHQPELREFFGSFVGSKVVKADGTLLERLKGKMPALPDQDGLRVHKLSSKYSLGFTFVGCEQVEGENCCTYMEATLYIGELKGDTLEKLSQPYQGRCDYTLHEVTEKRQKYEAAKKLADDLKSDLYPFGEYDR